MHASYLQALLAAEQGNCARQQGAMLDFLEQALPAMYSGALDGDNASVEANAEEELDIRITPAAATLAVLLKWQVLL